MQEEEEGSDEERRRGFSVSAAQRELRQGGGETCVSERCARLIWLSLKEWQQLAAPCRPAKDYKPSTSSKPRPPAAPPHQKDFPLCSQMLLTVARLWRFLEYQGTTKRRFYTKDERRFSSSDDAERRRRRRRRSVRSSRKTPGGFI